MVFFVLVALCNRHRTVCISMTRVAGVDPGGGGDPKLHKGGNNVAQVCAGAQLHYETQLNCPVGFSGRKRVPSSKRFHFLPGS